MPLYRVPIQYILKEWQFREVELKMVPPVFIPRPETETLIDIIRENAGSAKNGLEIGCGSGAISISLLKEFPEVSKVICTDISKFMLSKSIVAVIAGQLSHIIIRVHICYS